MATTAEESRSQSVLEKLKDEGEEVDSSSSDSDGEGPSSVSGRKEMPVHALLGGGKPADILLWRNTYTTASILAGVTVIWFLFELLGYQLLVLVCNSLMLSLASLFVWSNMSSFIRKSPPRYPVIHFEEDLFVRGGVYLTLLMNQSITYFQEVALGRNLKKFVMVAVGLWFLAVIGSWCSFLTLFYIAFIMLHTVLVLYERYADHVDCFADTALLEIKKQFNALGEKFPKKILPRVPLKNKKQH
ncbi:reticulon-like protein B4 isoform X1 [Nymphaea colorata]|nr:reticulon-like protein B4 isoform X1 [Nymphaea colorata]XP_031498724.1 reticulon-like protein B4 isoform X1 [Nymphaea colorata]